LEYQEIWERDGMEASLKKLDYADGEEDYSDALTQITQITQMVFNKGKAFADLSL
jgi:hypothetical protein